MNLTSKFWRRVGWTLFWLLLVHFLIETTGHHYLYNTLKNTVFKGQLGPGIQEYEGMPGREVETYEPQPWPVSDEYNQSKLTESEVAYHNQYESVSFVVVERGELVSEHYWQGFDKDSRSNSFSMAKSIVSLLTGIAIQNGQIDGLDKPVYWYLPQYKTELGEKITIRHLLTMSSGINFDEHYLNPFAFPARANYGDNLELLLRDYHPEEAPGEVYKYQSGTTQVLAFALNAATRMSLSDYATKHVWSKIGAENPAIWSTDYEEGMEKAFCCFNATARDFARIGQLYLNHGKWNGEQVIDSAFVAASTTPADLLTEDGEPNSIYGFQWWIGEHNGESFYFMRGIKGQYVIVCPKRELVVVRMGRKRHYKEDRVHPEDVYHYLDMAFRLTE